MLSGLYSAATAMTGAATAQDAIAENLAHANVPGYRRRGVVTETFDDTFASATGGGRPLRGTRVAAVYDDFSHGPLQATGNPLDLASTGNAFFVLTSPRGPVYTRNGILRLNAEGQLVSVNGYPVQGDGGPITIPQGTGKVSFGRDGTVYADGEQVGRLQLVEIPNPTGMKRVGTTLFEAGAAPTTSPDPGTNLIESGFREGSNVQVVHEMVAMISGLRHYEAAQRALRSMGEAVGLGTRPQTGG